MAYLRRSIACPGTRRVFATTARCASRADSIPPPDPEFDEEPIAPSLSSVHDAPHAALNSSSSPDLLSTVSAAATLTTAIPAFVPRISPPLSASLPRSYFLGHHASALSTMRNQLASINLVLEARDYRVPISSMNAELDRALAGRPRIIIYTKVDLCRRQRGMESLLKQWHAEHRHSVETVFHSSAAGGKSGGKTGAGRSSRKLLEVIKSVLDSGAVESSPVLGARALVVGMPNAGKSTLLNLLRSAGMQDSLFVGDKGTRTVRRAGKTVVLHKKAARTAAHPGVTRKLSAPVRILPKAPSSAETEEVGEDDGGIEEPFNTGNNGLFIVDTPGVFVPFVSSPEAMVKLSLAGTVKDGIVDSEILCDYLLYRVNLLNPRMYEKYCDPTNDVVQLLKAIAKKTGKILKGGKPNTEAAANWMVQQWRNGKFGDAPDGGNWKGGKTGDAGFVLDDVTKETLMEAQRTLDNPEISASQAKKREKVARLERIKGRAAAVEADI